VATTPVGGFLHGGPPPVACSLPSTEDWPATGLSSPARRRGSLHPVQERRPGHLDPTGFLFVTYSEAAVTVASLSVASASALFARDPSPLRTGPSGRPSRITVQQVHGSLHNGKQIHGSFRRANECEPVCRSRPVASPTGRLRRSSPTSAIPRPRRRHLRPRRP